MVHRSPPRRRSGLGCEMSLVGFKARNHRQQVARRGPRPDVDERGTDPAFFSELDRRFQFTLDVAALPHNATLPRFLTPNEDGLARVSAPTSGRRSDVVSPSGRPPDAG